MCVYKQHPNTYVSKNTAAALWPPALWEITGIGLAWSGCWHGSPGLAQRAARGWWEIKTSLNANCQREEDRDGDWEGDGPRGGGLFAFPILMWARCRLGHIFGFCLRMWLRDAFKHILSCSFFYLFLLNCLIFLYSWEMPMCFSRMMSCSCLEAERGGRGASVLCISPSRRTKEPARSWQQEGWEVMEVKSKLGWVRDHGGETQRDRGFAGVLFQQAGEAAPLNSQR